MEQGREPKTYLTRMWCRVRESNPGHRNGWRELSSLHPCSLKIHAGNGGTIFEKFGGEGPTRDFGCTNVLHIVLGSTLCDHSYHWNGVEYGRYREAHPSSLHHQSRQRQDTCRNHKQSCRWKSWGPFQFIRILRRRGTFCHCHERYSRGMSSVGIYHRLFYITKIYGFPYCSLQGVSAVMKQIWSPSWLLQKLLELRNPIP